MSEIKYNKWLHNILDSLSEHILKYPEKFLLCMRDKNGAFIEIKRDYMHRRSIPFTYLYYRIIKEVWSNNDMPGDNRIHSYLLRNFNDGNWGHKDRFGKKIVQREVKKLEKQIRVYLKNFPTIMQREKIEQDEYILFQRNAEKRAEDKKLMEQTIKSMEQQSIENVYDRLIADEYDF